MISNWLKRIRAKNGVPFPIRGLVFVAPYRFSKNILISYPVKKKYFEISGAGNLHQTLFHQGRSVIIAIPRMSKSISVIDFKSGKETNQINAPENSYFYGHGCFSSDGKFLCLTEIQRPNGEGFLSIWSVDDFSLVRRISSGGVAPHDCAYSDEDSSLYVVNGGNIPNVWDLAPGAHFSYTSLDYGSVCKISLVDGGVSELCRISSEFGAPGHICFGRKSMAVITAPDNLYKSGYIFIQRPDGVFKRTEFPPHIHQPRGQALSIAYDAKQDLFAVTHPDAELLSFWNATSGKFVKALPLHANGIQVPSPGYALINTVQNSRAVVINTRTWDINILDDLKVGNGSHLTMVQLTSFKG